MKAESGQAGRAAGARAGRRGQRGFTIMETTVSMLILMVVGLGAASLFLFAVNNNTSSAERAMAVALAQKRMEWIRNLPWDDPNSTDDFLGLPTNAWQNQQVTIDSRQFSVQTLISPDADTQMRTITVRVTGGRGQVWARGAVVFTSQRGAR